MIIISLYISAIRSLYYIKNTAAIEFCEYLLNEFQTTSLDLFGEGFQSITFHFVNKHLIEDVKKHGSLIGHSMFSLEGTLGIYNKTLNGTVNLSEQYIKSKLTYYIHNIIHISLVILIQTIFYFKMSSTALVLF